ncbi:MAG: hypothetical protein AB1650_02795 [Candidatus Omnitrophota bacterium]
MPRSVWGSSNRVLTNLRKNTEPRAFGCDREKVFNAVFEMTRPYGKKGLDSDKYVLFSMNREKGYMILMNVPGAVDTTEVGVFFDSAGAGQTRVEVTSLSSRAKRTVEEAVFARIGSACSPVP